MRHSKNERMELAREFAECAKALVIEIKDPSRRFEKHRFA